MHHKLAVTIRCHLWPGLVLDTLSAIFRNSTTTPLVGIASDHNQSLAAAVQKRFPQVKCYVSAENWKWGAGLYGLMSETILFLDSLKDVTYEHFLTIDYDTLPIGRGWDEVLLNAIEKNPAHGLFGSHIYASPNWAARYWEAESVIRDIFASRGLKAPPKSYIPGESCLGGMMALSRVCLNRMRDLRLFDAPFRDIRGRTKLVDDPWTALLVRATGCEIFDLKSFRDYCFISYQSAGEWRSYVRRGLKIFNLGELSRGDKTGEIVCRNHFRAIRRERRLLTLADAAP